MLEDVYDQVDSFAASLRDENWDIEWHPVALSLNLGFSATALKDMN